MKDFLKSPFKFEPFNLLNPSKWDLKIKLMIIMITILYMKHDRENNDKSNLDKDLLDTLPIPFIKY